MTPGIAGDDREAFLAGHQVGMLSVADYRSQAALGSVPESRRPQGWDQRWV